jgi:hypothetical protein
LCSLEIGAAPALALAFEACVEIILALSMIAHNNELAEKKKGKVQISS